MAAQPAGNVRENDVAVIELDRKGRARKDLLDIADYFKRGFLDVLRGLRRLWQASSGSVFSIANRYGRYSFYSLPTELRIAASRRIGLAVGLALDGWDEGLKIRPIFQRRNFLDQAKDRALVARGLSHKFGPRARNGP